MTDCNDLATAHQAWEQRWTSAETRKDWLIPESLVVESVPFLRARGVERVLDIGCGVGRHALFLAQQGFQVAAIDLSRSGIDVATQAATDNGVTIDFQLAQFTDLPYRDESLDLVLAWNVIYHGDGSIVRTAIAEIHRVLKPEGLFLGTMISKRHHRYGEGREIQPNTFIIDDDDEKAHAHFYCDDRELIALLDCFQLFQLRDHQQRDAGNWHWEFLAERRRVS
jgi:tellurite methyltransferase